MNLRKNLHRYINLYNYIEAYRSNTLPNGYTRLDYIESTGTQHIDTGVGLDAVNKVTGKVTFLSKPTLAYIAGARGVNGRAIGYALYSSVHDGFTIYNSLWPDQGVDISTGQILEFETVMKNAQQSFVVDGDNVLNNNVQISDFINSNQITLFSLGSNEYLAKARIYAIKFYKDSSLVADFIPASHVENSVTVVGMYDMVSGTFFTNAGTGEFIAGPESSDNSSNDSLVLQDAIKDSLKSLKAYGKTELKPDTLLDTVVANGGTEILSHDYMDSITAKGKTEQRKLPVGYQELEYIESTGTQWIDTGIKDIVNSEFEITAQQTAISGNFPTIVGALDGDTSPATDYKVIVGLSTTDNKYYTQTGGSTGFHVSNIPNDTNKHKFNIKVGTNQTILTIDDTNVYPGSYAVTTTQKYSLFICARNKSTVSNFTQQKVFSFTARKNDTLISNLVPARNASGVVGMYDTVSCTFFTNSGTGSFIAGPVVNLPEEYERIEYIESSGTQYIDTGIVPTNTDDIIFEFEFTQLPSTGTALIGCRDNPSVGSGLNIGLSSSLVLTVDFFGTRWDTGTTVALNNIYKVAIINKVATLYVNDTAVGTYTFTATGNLTYYAVLCGFRNGSSTATPTPAYIKLLQAKIGIHSFIPCENSSNILGVYDTANDTFLTNAGTGTFTAGPSLKVPSDYTVLDYIETTDGTEYINPQLSGNARWVITAQTNAIKGSSQSLITSTDSASGGTWYGEFTSTQHWDIISGGTTITPTTKTTADLTFNSNGATGTIGGVSVTRSIACTQGNWRIFGTVSGIGPYVGKLFDAKVYQNNTLVRNLVPAIRNSDGIIGLYDTVSGVLYTNSGTGKLKAGYKANILPDNPVDIYCNNGALKVNLNLYWTEYHGYELSQNDGITTKENGGVNVSGMVDCRTIKSFKITTISPQGAFHVFKYRADNTFINASSTANIGDIITLEDNVGFFRIQYNFTSGGVDTENILIYNSVCNLGEIYTNGTNEIVSKHSKNLYNYKTAIDAYLTDTGGLTPSIQGKTSVLINVKPSTTYTLKFLRTAAEIYTRVCSYDSNEEFISLLVKDTDVTAGYKTNTFTTDVNAKYIKVSFKADSTEVQLEENSTATAYEPYRCENATCEDLFDLGTYKDSQEILSGTITRNIGIKVLDGTENWTAYNDGEYFPLGGGSTLPETAVAYCSHFNYAGSGRLIVDLPMNSFTIAVNGNCSFKSDKTLTKAEWKAWLAQQYAAGTPVMIIYPLATATSETVSKQINNKEIGDIIEVIDGSIEGLEVTNISSTHTIPLPDYPLDINCNNGVLKLTTGFDINRIYKTGNPSVSNEGIYTTNSSQSYVRTQNNVNFSTANSWSFKWKFTYKRANTDQGIMSGEGKPNVQAIINSAGKPRFSVGDGTDWSIIWNDSSLTFVYQENVEYENEIYFNGTRYGYKVNGVEIGGVDSTAKAEDTYFALGVERQRTSTQYTRCIWDLSKTSLIVDGIEQFPWIVGAITTDGTVETLSTHGKNLFDISTSVLGGLASADGSETISTTRTRTGFIPFNSSATITIDNADNFGIVNTYLYNANKVFIGTSVPSPSGGVKQFTASDSNAKYIRVTFCVFNSASTNINLDTFKQSKIQIEQGSTATPYEPYYDGDTATCEDLLNAGAYTDTQDVISGVVTRNLGVKVLDGTENWAVNSMISHHFTYKLPNQADSTVAYIPSYCTHFLSDGGVDDNTCKLQYRVFSIRYDAANENVAIFKQYLADQYAAGTPVIVVYPLATATTETVDKQRMRKGIVSITEASMTGLTVNTTESVHTIPSPDFPLDLYCNNGKLKENTSTSGVNEIVATDIVDGYLNCTVGQAPVINSSTASQIIKHALRVKAGKSYKFSYVSSLAGNRESDVIGDDGLAKEKVTLICSVGLNEYTITLNNSGELWLTIQSGDLVSVNPICYEIGKVAGSGTPEVLTVTGKNWFDKTPFNTNVDTNITPVQFQIPNGTYLMTTDFPPQDNTVYTNVWILAGKQTTGYDSLVNGVSKGNPKTITVTDGWCTVFYRSTHSAIPRNPKDYKWQLEEGTRPTQYENYMNINCSVEDLLSVGNYQDIEDLKAGITNRKVGIKVLDGTENWVTTGDQKNIIIQNATSLWNVMAGVGGYCTHLTVLKSGEETFAGACRFAMDFNIYEYKTAFSVNNITEFKQFLADQYALGTPVIVVYPLATETTESTITQNVDIVSGTNTIERNSEYFNSLGTEVNYKKLR